jgi:threonine dehydrogenase-like Zn-dependent dehydrogenase
MKAAQFFGPKDIRVQKIPEPEPNETQVLVSVEWCGICGSDLHEFLTG